MSFYIADSNNIFDYRYIDVNEKIKISSTRKNSEIFYVFNKKHSRWVLNKEKR